MSLNVYPVTETEEFAGEEQWSVLVNGVPVRHDFARVSSYPLNRRWPGHQRELYQTEIAPFLLLAADEAVTFTVKPPFPVEKAVVRPASLGVKPAVAPDGEITFTIPRPAYFTLETAGRHRALHVFCDPPEREKPERTEDVLYFGPGVHEAGIIELKSGQTLYLDEGAVVYACVHALDAEGIRILGRGILDNSHNREEILYAASAEGNETALSNAFRRHTIQLAYCTGVLIDGITIRDSLVYNIRPIGCRDLTIRNVKIIGCWRFNSDGIDMHNCEHVLVENCFLRTFDDAICIKGFDFYAAEDPAAALREATYHNGEVYDCFRDVLIRRCVIWNDWGYSLEIGAETRAREICDVTFADCDVIHVTSQAINCNNVDYADVHDVVYRDIRVEMDEEIPRPVIQKRDGEVYAPEGGYVPALAGAWVTYHPEYSFGGGKRGRNRKLRIENVTVTGVDRPRVEFFGYREDAKTSGVLLKNFRANGKRLMTEEDFLWTVGDFADDVRYEP